MDSMLIKVISPLDGSEVEVLLMITTNYVISSNGDRVISVQGFGSAEA